MFALESAGIEVRSRRIQPTDEVYWVTLCWCVWEHAMPPSPPPPPPIAATHEAPSCPPSVQGVPGCVSIHACMATLPLVLWSSATLGATLGVV